MTSPTGNLPDDSEVALNEAVEAGGPVGFVSAKVHHLRTHLGDPLYRNGYALMLNTGLTAALGLVYWIVAAHVYSPTEVGRSSAQVSGMILISAVTQLNLASVLIRFTGRAGRATRRLTLATYAASTLLATFVSTAVLVVAHFTTQHGVLHVSLPFALWFVVATAVWSIFCLQDAAMIGLRRAIWVPVENGTFGVVKVILLFAFVPVFGATGIFASWTIPVAISLIPINWAILRIFIPAHVKEAAALEQPIDRQLVRRFIAGDYISSLFSQAMTTLMPVIVVVVLNEDANAFFYMAQTITMALDMIAFNLASSLTAEGAGKEDQIPAMASAVLKRTFMLVLPAAAALLVAAPLLLSVFGSEYTKEATTLLRLLAIATIPKVVISLHGALARLMHKTYRNAAMTSIQAITLVGGSVLFMNHLGVVGVGVAAIISQTLTAALVLPWVLRVLHHQKDALPPVPDAGRQNR